MGAIEEIRDRIDIVEFISGYVQLKKAGRTYKGLCPFHSEKTPSFVVFPETKTWHCFGSCGTGGTVFDFVMRREGVDFSDALRQLADRAGVSLAPPTAESQAANEQRTRLHDIHAAAALFFHNLLRQSSHGENARDYLSGRALDDKTVETFQLGCAPDAWEGLKKYLMGRGYSQQDLLDAGLVIKKEDRQEGYDRFRNRLIIPIRDRQGRVIAFGARALNPNDVPKYLNSPQTPIFDKGATLFGLDMAKQAIREADRVVLVEGYMDVLSAHQHGHANVVAGMGTALTEAQLKQIGNLTKNMVLALDADSAGSAATLRGIDTARQTMDQSQQAVMDSRGLVHFERRLKVDIRIAGLPQGKDPDDILRESPQMWSNIIDQALPVVNFYMQSVAAQHDLSTGKGKSQFVNQVMPLLRELGDSVERAHYVNQLAQLVKVDEKVLRDDLARTPVQSRRPAHRPGARPFNNGQEMQPGQLTFGPEEHILAMILTQPAVLGAANQDLAELGIDGLSEQDFRNVQDRQVYSLVLKWDPGSQAGASSLDHLGEQLDPVLRTHLDFLRTQAGRPQDVPTNQVREEVVTRILQLRGKRLQEEIANLRFMLGEFDQEGSREEHTRYQQMVAATSRKLNIIEKSLFKRSAAGRRKMSETSTGVQRI